MAATPLAGLRISAGLGLTDAEYDEFYDEMAGDRSHLDFQRSPTWSFNGSVSYGFPVSDYGTLTLRTDYYAQNEVHLNVDNTEQLKQGKYGILSARANFALENGRTEISGYVTNASDRYYKRSGTDLSFLGVSYYSSGEPRMYGLELVQRF